MKVTGEKADIGARERRELQAELSAYLKAPKFSHLPTNERTRKAGAVPKAVAPATPHDGRSRAHRFDAPLETLMQKLPAEWFQAVDRLRWADEARTGRPKNVDWQGSGRSNPATRLGVTETQQKAAHRWAYFEARLSPGTKAVLEAMVYRQPNGEMPAVADAMEWARVWLRSDYQRYQSLAWKLALERVAEIVAWVERGYGRELEKRRREDRDARDARFQQHRR
jgi:hypothetical protein